MNIDIDYVQKGLLNVSDMFMTTVFPAGEINVTFTKSRCDEVNAAEDVLLVAKNHDALDIMALAQKVDILRSVGAKHITLALPYMPHGRQDRRTAIGAPFALRSYAAAINGLCVDEVLTIDPHSDVIEALYDNIRFLPLGRVLSFIIDSYVAIPLTIIAPDAGAAKKIYGTLSQIIEMRPDLITEVVVASKQRNLMTGEIIGTVLPEFNLNSNVLIVDDICDGGRTFTAIKDIIVERENGRGGVGLRRDLFVTHGIFSKPDVFYAFTNVYSTDSFTPYFTADNHHTINLTLGEKK